MSRKQPRLWAPKVHRAVDYNARAIERAIKTGEVYAAIKHDGFRCLLGYHLDGQTSRFAATTREGIELVSLRPFYPELKAYWSGLRPLPRAVVLDTEVVIRGIPFEEASGHLRRHSPISEDLRDSVRFICFDAVHRSTMLGENKATVYNLLDRRDVIQSAGTPSQSSDALLVLEDLWRVYKVEQIEKLFQSAREAGHEGLVIKANIPYRNGKVTGWWKRKDDIEEDGTVEDFVWGDEGKANAGMVVGFVVRLESGLLVNVTGLTSDMKHKVTADWRLGKSAKYMGRCVKVTAMERTAKGTLRHPFFAGFRDIVGHKGLKV
jgi:ATP-dependent DNA ligase